MPSIDERLAFLEGRVEDHSREFGELRDAVRQVDSKVDRFREELSTGIAVLDSKCDRRFDALEGKVERFREELAGRLDSVDQKNDRRFDALDSRVDRIRAELSGRLDAVDQKMSRHLLWTLGVQITVLLAVIGALLGS